MYVCVTFGIESCICRRINEVVRISPLQKITPDSRLSVGAVHPMHTHTVDCTVFICILWCTICINDVSLVKFIVL